MKINIKVIKFTTILSSILLIITYLISLADSYNWFNISWLSNSFLFAIFSGAFASTLVVLFCEIHKYFVNKKDSRNKIFFHTAFLYFKLIMIKKEIDNHLANPKQEITLTFDSNVNDALENIEHFRNIDYASFLKKDKLMNIFNEVNLWFNSEVEMAICDINYIKLARNQDELDCLINTRQKGIVTSSSKNIKRALQLNQKKLELILSQLDKILTDIDICSKQKNRWEIKKTSILKGLSSAERGSLNDFFNQEKNINEIYKKINQK